MGANFKFMNAGYPIHAAVEAAMALFTDHAIEAAEIDAVEVGMPTNAMRVVDNRKMQNICVQDMVSAALVPGGPSLRDSPFPEILADPAFAPMRAVSWSAQIGPRSRATQRPRRQVRITTRDGATVVRRVDWPKGHSAGDGITWDDLSGKWMEALPDVDVARVIALSRRLEQLDDVSQPLRAFDP